MLNLQCFGSFISVSQEGERKVPVGSIGEKEKVVQPRSVRESMKLAIKKIKDFFFHSKPALMKTVSFPFQMLHGSCIMPGMPLSRRIGLQNGFVHFPKTGLRRSTVK